MFQYNVPNCSHGHYYIDGRGLSVAVNPQVGDKSHWNRRRGGLARATRAAISIGRQQVTLRWERERARRAVEGASPLTYAWTNTSLTLAHNALHSPS